MFTRLNYEVILEIHSAKFYYEPAITDQLVYFIQSVNS